MIQDSNSSPNDDTREDMFDERNDFVNAAGWKAEFAAVGWSRLIPFRNWFTDRPWTLLWVQFIAFAFGFPFLLIGYYRNRESTLVEAAWALGGYFAIVWAVLIHRCIRPERIGTRRIVGTWLFTSVLGVVAVVFVSVVGSYLPVIRDVYEASESASIFGRLIGMTLAVGLVEESAKLIPVIWFASKFDPPPRPTTIAYLGVISGLAFGATEAISYSVIYALGNATAQIGYGDYLLYQLLRLVSLPFLHAIWTGTSGYFVGLSLVTKTSRRAMIVVGLAGVSILHGAYNSFADGWLGFVIAMLSLAIFIGYIRNEDEAVTAVSPTEATT